MAESKGVDALIRILEECVVGGSDKGGWRGDPHSFFGTVKQKAASQGVAYDPAIVLEHWHRLARLGIISVLGAQLPAVHNDAMVQHFLLRKEIDR